MPVDPDDQSAVVRYALETTRAIAVCPFHSDVTVRIGDDAAESHAWARARNIIKSDGTLSEKSFVTSLGRPQTVVVLGVRITL
jgi:hypothetical protein